MSFAVSFITMTTVADTAAMSVASSMIFVAVAVTTTTVAITAAMAFVATSRVALWLVAWSTSWVTVWLVARATSLITSSLVTTRCITTAIAVIALPFAMFGMTWVGKIALIMAVAYDHLVMLAFITYIFSTLPVMVRPWRTFIDHYFMPMI
jgi:hypothetical protein